MSAFFERVELGQELPTLEFRFTPEGVADFVKVWTPGRAPNRFDDDEAARGEGFAKPIVPSHLSIAYLSQVVLAWSERVELLRMDTICRAVMLNDERVVCRGLVIDKGPEGAAPIAHVDLYMERESGERALTANATVWCGEGSAMTSGMARAQAGDDITRRLERVLGPDADLKIEYDRSVLGVEVEIDRITVTEQQLLDYARATGVTAAIYRDPRAARKGPYGGVVALPTFCSICSGSRANFPMRGPDVKINFGRTGQEAGLAVENYLLIRPGDVLRVTSKAKEVYSKTGRSGPMVFTVYEDNLYNQRGEKVAAVRRSSVRF